MVAEFNQHSIDVLDVYYCPHHSEHALGHYLQACQCRKPEPGMLMQAVTDHNIDLSDSVLVGGKLSDIQAEKRAGVKRCFLLRLESQCQVL